MVKLFNIVIKEDEISCYYEPEASNMIGHVAVDTKSFEIKSVRFSDHELGKKMYVSHVRSELEKILTSNSQIPKEITTVWY